MRRGAALPPHAAQRLVRAVFVFVVDDVAVAAAAAAAAAAVVVVVVAAAAAEVGIVSHL